MLDKKAISERHFIDILYFFLHEQSLAAFKMEPTMEEKEFYARMALDLHKVYWDNFIDDLNKDWKERACENIQREIEIKRITFINNKDVI